MNDVLIGDAINGCFELLAGLFIFNRCRVLYEHKQVRGVSTVSTAFMFCWGVWNLHYYPGLAQDLSWLGGLVVVSANCLWVCMQIYYVQREVYRQYLKDVEVLRQDEARQRRRPKHSACFVDLKTGMGVTKQKDEDACVMYPMSKCEQSRCGFAGGIGDCRRPPKEDV